jgi:uncharacterized metal-binding protein (TIGR02443 family)
MVFRAQRRFIAGAVCPKCAVMDKLVVFKKDDKSFRECVSCGYHQEMKFSPTFKPLPTRLDLAKEKAKKDEESQEVVRIVTPGSKC